MATSIRETDLVDLIVETVRRHYSEPITLRLLGKIARRNPNYIGRAFKSQVGVTVRAYLTCYRVGVAADRILQGDKIEAVSMCVGYRSKTNFYRHFKYHFGMTPQEYRRSAAHSADASQRKDYQMPNGAGAGFTNAGLRHVIVRR